MEEVVLKVKVEGSGDSEAKIKTVKQQLREAKEAALQAKEGTEEYFQALQKAAGLADQLKDVNEAVNTLNPGDKAAAFGTLINTVAGGFQTITGLYGLLGEKSEDVEKMLLRVQAASALAMGVQSLVEAQKQWKNITALIKQSSIFQKAYNAATAAGAIVQKAFDTAINATSKSFNGLKAAIAGTGIGLLVVGIGTLASKFLSFSKSVDTSTESMTKFNYSISNVSSAIDEYTATEQKAYDVAKQALELAKLRGDSAEEILKLENNLIDASTTLAKAKKKHYETDLKYNDEKISKLQNELKANGKLSEQKQKDLDDLIALRDDEYAQIKELGKKIDDDAFDRVKLTVAFNKKKADDTKENLDKIANELKKNEQDTTKLSKDELEKRLDNAKKEYDEYIGLLRVKRDESWAIEDETTLKLKEELRKRLDAQMAADDERSAAEQQSLIEAQNIQNAKLSIARSTVAGLSALGDILIKDGKKATAFQKALALAGLAIDTAQAIGGLTAASAKNPLNAATSGIAGAAQFASGIVQILANIAQAKKLLFGGDVNNIAGGGGGGGSNIPSPSGGFNPPSIQPPSNTSGLIQEGENFKVYVVESDITNSQMGVQQNKKKALITI
jgi:hypothetical protein